MTISAGDRVIALMGADGELVAHPVGRPTASGDRCMAALAADGELAAVAVEPVELDGERGFAALAADGELAAMQGAAVGRTVCTGQVTAQFHWNTPSSDEEFDSADLEIDGDDCTFCETGNFVIVDAENGYLLRRSVVLRYEEGDSKWHLYAMFYWDKYVWNPVGERWDWAGDADLHAWHGTSDTRTGTFPGDYFSYAVFEPGEPDDATVS